MIWPWDDIRTNGGWEVPACTEDMNTGASQEGTRVYWSAKLTTAHLNTLLLWLVHSAVVRGLL